MKVVTIGGGSGTPVINEALLLAGVKEIKSIVTVMDSGGISGRMRTDSRGEEVAYSDALRTLLSLLSVKETNKPKIKTLIELLRKRNDRGRDLGYTIFSHFFDKELGFSPIQEILEKLTEVKFCGEVLPITTDSTNLVFQTKSGQIYVGEHELDDKRMSADEVQKVWLQKEVLAYPKSLKAIKEADLIIFSCGSLYGSVIANLLPIGVKNAFKESRAKKVLVTNLASTRNETHNFYPEDFIKIFQEYTGLLNPIDILLVPKITRTEFENKYSLVAKRYSLDHSFFLGWDEKILKKLNVSVVTHDAVTVDPVLGRLRHDPKKMAEVFKTEIVYN